MITDIKVPSEAGGAEERREVSPGGFTPCADPGGVDPVFWGIGAKPAHGGFAILELGWKSRIIAQSIADTGDDIAPLREFPHRARMFVAAFPSPPRGSTGLQAMDCGPDRAGKDPASALGYRLRDRECREWLSWPGKKTDTGKGRRKIGQPHMPPLLFAMEIADGMGRGG